MNTSFSVQRTVIRAKAPAAVNEPPFALQLGPIVRHTRVPSTQVLPASIGACVSPRNLRVGSRRLRGAHGLWRPRPGHSVRKHRRGMHDIVRTLPTLSRTMSSTLSMRQRMPWSRPSSSRQRCRRWCKPSTTRASAWPTRVWSRRLPAVVAASRLNATVIDPDSKRTNAHKYCASSVPSRGAKHMRLYCQSQVGCAWPQMVVRRRKRRAAVNSSSSTCSPSSCPKRRRCRG